MTDPHEPQRWWDLDAPTYDDSPSHALGDPVEAACWRAALRRHLPEPPASVLEVGAGTGAIGLLAAELGYDVTTLDLSPNMLARAIRVERLRDVEWARRRSAGPVLGWLEHVPRFAVLADA